MADGFKLDLEEPEKKEEEVKEDEELKEAGALKQEQEEKEAEAIDSDVILVIDGEEKKVPLSKVKDAGIRTLQKESAADKRLEEAARLKKQAEDMIEEAKKKAAQLPDKTEFRRVSMHSSHGRNGWCGPTHCARHAAGG